MYYTFGNHHNSNLHKKNWSLASHHQASQHYYDKGPSLVTTEHTVRLPVYLWIILDFSHTLSNTRGGELLLLDAPTSSHHEGQYTTPCYSPCVTLARRGELSSVNHRCDSLGYHVLSYHSHPLSAISLFFRSPLFTSMCDARGNWNK